MGWTSDPSRDYDRHDARQESRLKRFPRCGFCKQRIQDGYFYEIEDDFVCEECLAEHFRRSVDDYID